MLKSLTSFNAFPKIEKNIQKTSSLGGNLPVRDLIFRAHASLRHVVTARMKINKLVSNCADNQSFQIFFTPPYYMIASISYRASLLTLLVAVLLSFLTLSEFIQYVTISQKYEFLVDRPTGNLGAHININADITVAMACENLRIDVLDVAGTSLHARNNEFTKTPVKFHTEGLVSVGARKSKSKLDVHRIVVEAQRKQRDIVDRFGKLDACRVKGHISVNKVAGMFHITALGHGYMDGKHVPHESMNFTHRVDKLSFGIDYPGLVNPLDSSLEIADGYFEMFQYFVSIVPTIFVDKRKTFGSIILTNQYAVTDYKKIVGAETKEAGIPDTMRIGVKRLWLPVALVLFASLATLTTWRWIPDDDNAQYSGFNNHNANTIKVDLDTNLNGTRQTIEFGGTRTDDIVNLINLAIILDALVPPTPDPNDNNGDFDVMSLVMPRIGSEGSGHVWVGATAPNGMVKVGVDTDHSETGYLAGGVVYGIAHTHVSGTGGGRSYQNTHMSMHWTHSYSKNLSDTAVDLPPISKVLASLPQSEVAAPGFYSALLLNSSVNVSFTAANKAAIHRWNVFPSFSLPSDQSKNSSVQSATFHTFLRPSHDSMQFLDASISIQNTSRIVMRSKYQDAWANGLGLGNQRGIYSLFSCFEFVKRPSAIGIWGDQNRFIGYDFIQGQLVSSEYSQTGFYKFNASGFENGFSNESLLQVSTTSSARGQAMGAYLSYKFDLKLNVSIMPPPLEYRIGLSYISIDQACNNLDNHGNDSFDSMHKNSHDAWEDRINGIKVSGPLDDVDMTLLYSNLYRVFLMPANKTGENPSWNASERSTKPFYDDYYCIWDTFRTLNPLLTLIAPSLTADLLNSLVTMAQHTGGLLGDCTTASSWAIVQSGSNADILFSEALQKGIKGVDYEGAYKLIMNEMNPNEKTDFLFQGRGNMKEWIEFGYIPATSNYGIASHFRRSSGSRTVEYAYDDFTVGEMARLLPQHEAEADIFRNRSRNWENLWNPDTESHGFKGFLMPKYMGNFTTLDPANGCIPKRGGNAEFYEDCSWTYSFYAPHNMKRVIELMGGDEMFVERVNAFFDLKIYNPGNEPGFLVPFLYHYVGRPDLSVERMISIMDHLYLPTPLGLPGNDDAGTMAAQHIFWSLGLFPVAGQDIC
ncbi:hypothetical protein HK100_012420 [Physocladia obscura]|uniref:Alpha-1,2-mannosidase n=1 Tax=Physocladia obscura TaxID=109957 RepID=A0AAD5TE69_9FUNG|nr:hypothetical protein HK100_012420 [Physocladia obscura]